METQNLVISFDYSWFLAKNLAYAECRIMKFHYLIVKHAKKTFAILVQTALTHIDYGQILKKLENMEPLNPH